MALSASHVWEVRTTADGGAFAAVPGLLAGAIDALKAFDGGSVDSGVRDEDLRAQVIAHLRSFDPADRRRALAEFARRYLDDEAIARGYGLDDVVSLAEWVDGLGIAEDA